MVKYQTHSYSEPNISPIGHRIIKSALGVFLCLVIYLLRGKQGMPLYSALAVLWCTHFYTKNTVKNALRRAAGTCLGAFYGLIFLILVVDYLPPDNLILRFLIISIFIIPIVYVNILSSTRFSVIFSIVVYLSIVLSNLGDANPYLFVIYRIIDVLIGIVLAFILNYIKIPRKRRLHTLFASELYNTLLNYDDTITPYTKIELNCLLENGINFTISTVRSPAAIHESLKDIQLKLPSIVMDGAAIYDTTKNEYDKIYSIAAVEAQEIYNYIIQNNYHVFTNIIIENSLLTLYGEFVNETEKKLYNKLRTSTYRNFVNMPLLPDQDVICLTVLDTDNRISSLYALLMQKKWTDEYKVLHYPSDNYKDYSYLKIYNKDASQQNMIQYLQDKLSLTDYEYFDGDSMEYEYGGFYNHGDKMIKLIGKRFAPPIWSSISKE